MVPECLHLFTSSIRELYIADAINVLAAPVGSIYRFRYDGKYLDANTRERWKREHLISSPVIVHFSLQHPADFHPAVFIPLRRGKVTKTLVEGDTYIVYFRLGVYLPLRDGREGRDTQRKKLVEDYTAGLKTLLGPDRCPDEGIHATLGRDADHLVDSTGDLGSDFATIVRFLTPALALNPRIYWRVVCVIKEKTDEIVELSDDGNMHLSAGSGYTMQLAHYQCKPSAAETAIKITSPKAIELIGAERILLQSRYDVIPIRLFPPHRDNPVTCELSISTEALENGPTVRLPLVIEPPRAETWSGPLLGIGGGIALALPAALASDKLLAVRLVLALGGALLAGLALWLRRRHGLSNS